jgi:Zn-dependent protease
MTSIDLPYIICSILCFIPAMVLHEMAHGFAAYKLGDPTAKQQGRLSFNPAKHIDPFGTVILPLFLMVMNMPIFGYAKPVPYNPRYFKDPRKGDLIVGLAGPLANLVQALVGALIMTGISFGFNVLYDANRELALSIINTDAFNYIFYTFFPMYILINLYFMFFNLIPIPPLDGSSIFAFILPVKYLPTYYKIQQYALPIFMVVCILVPQIFNVNPISAYLNVTAVNLFYFLVSFV